MHSLLCLALVSAASDTPAWLPSLSHSDPGVHDLELTLKARKALFQGETLAGFSLGVSVRNRAATLWGAVPSAELSRHAEQTLRSVLGLTSIRNQLQIEWRREPEKTPSVPRLTLPFQTEPTPVEQPLSQGVLVRRPPGSGLAADAELRWRAPEEKSVESQDSRWKSAGADLTKAVEALRLADQRFRRIKVRVEGGTVYLAGSVYRWDHLHELARSISRLPEVKDVVFEEIQADLKD